MTPKDAFPWYGLFIGHGAHSWCNPGKSLPPAGMHHLPPLENGDRCGVAVSKRPRGRSGGCQSGKETKKRSEAWYSKWYPRFLDETPSILAAIFEANK